jgi:hypothetical protein
MTDAPRIPDLTGGDAAAQTIAALVYLVVGVAAWLRAPRDVRTRVFLALALVSVVAFELPAYMWLRGTPQLMEMPRWIVAVLLTSLSTAALLLFHFTQVFPWRRPWLSASGPQMPIAYALTPLVIAGLTLFAPASLQDFSLVYLGALFVFGFPLLVVLAIVLPVAAILSLVKSYREADAAGYARARPALFWILVSQVAGGALTFVFAPVLAVVAPQLQTALTLAAWGLALVTPIAFALSVWKYDVLAERV